MALALAGVTVASDNGFAVVLVASCPLRPLWMAAQLLEFAGPTFSIPMGDAPVAFYGWHAVENVQVRPRCAETGLIDRSSTNPVDAHGRSAALEREGEEHGGSLWWAPFELCGWEFV